MAFAKKTWKDRITEFPTRRTLTKSDGSSELVTVSRAEGTVSQEGDSFSAENMNNLENRIGNEFGEINKSLTGKVDGFADGTYAAVTGLAYDATNKRLGIKVGADTVIPFNGNYKIVACFSWYYEGNSQSDYQPYYLNPKIDNANVIQVSAAKTSGPGTKVTIKNVSSNTLHIIAVDSNSSKIMIDTDLPAQASKSFNSPRGTGYAWLL